MTPVAIAAFFAGSTLGYIVAGWFLRRTDEDDGAKMTFHRPREGVLVVEVRQDLSATYAASIRDWLQQVEGEGTAVLLVCLGDRP